MTIALAINVGDSLVFASDSATTQTIATPSGTAATRNIWNRATTIFNLRKGLPIGAMTWGKATVGTRSISTMAKDLRLRLSGGSPAHADWELDTSTYTIGEVADRVRQYFYDDLPDPRPTGGLGLMIGGYSAQSDDAEWYTLLINDNGTSCEGPAEQGPAGEVGAATFGQPEAFARLVNGTSLDLPQALINLGVAPGDAPAYTKAIQSQVARPVVFGGMPVGEVIDLAKFLVDATINFVRFSPGHATVGGPIEVAAITKHEGFKWVQRKHHFPASLNRPEEHS